MNLSHRLLLSLAASVLAVACKNGSEGSEGAAGPTSAALESPPALAKPTPRSAAGEPAAEPAADDGASDLAAAPEPDDERDASDEADDDGGEVATERVQSGDKRDKKTTRRKPSKRGKKGSVAKRVGSGAAGDGDDHGEPDAAELGIKRVVIASGVSDREPVGAAASYEAGANDRIYAFVEVGNESRVESELTLSFYRDGGRELGGSRLEVGAAPRWRTWSFTRVANKPGKWYAVVRDGEGKELGRKGFTVTGDGVAADETPKQQLEKQAQKRKGK
jgi:hypothetical protein